VATDLGHAAMFAIIGGVADLTDDVLRELTLFQRLSVGDRRRLATVSHLVEFERGDTIFAEGDDADSMVYLVDGRVKVFKSSTAGKEIILAIFGAGDQLGAVAVYENMPYPVSSVAIEHTTCVRVPRREWLALLEEHPELVRGLLSGLAIRLSELTQRVTELSGPRVESRLARLFLKLAGKIGRKDRGGVFVPMGLSRQELADLTGTTIETTIRILSRWQKDDVVHTVKDGFVILDQAALEDVVGT
jgi:CRP/FNR family transcriptional regulator